MGKHTDVTTETTSSKRHYSNQELHRIHYSTYHTVSLEKVR